MMLGGRIIEKTVQILLRAAQEKGKKQQSQVSSHMWEITAAYKQKEKLLLEWFGSTGLS